MIAVQARDEGWSDDRVRLTPSVSLGWYMTHRAGFKESGAGDAGLTVEPYDAAWGRARLGLELAPLQPAAGRFAWYGRLAWVSDFRSEKRKASARFIGAPDGAFTVTGTPVAPDGFEVALGAGGTVGERVTWGVSYGGEFRSDGGSHQVQGSLGISF